MQVLKLFGIVLVLFLLMDLIWLGVLMSGFYSRELGDLARREGVSLAPRWIAAFVVYVLIPAGIVLYVRPAMGAQAPLWQSFLWGAGFGLIVYGVYDLTNMAVLDKWTWRMTLADMAWGGFLCGTLAAVMQWADQWLSGR